MIFGANNIGLLATTNFLAPGYIDVAPTASIAVRATKDLLMTKMQVHHGVPAGAAANVTYTLRKNGTDTALSVVVSTNSADGSVEAEVEFAPGDLIEVVADHGILLDGTVAATAALTVNS